MTTKFTDVPLVVASVQMTSSDCLEENLKTAARLVESAAIEHQATLILLPENFALFDGGAAFKLGASEISPSGRVRSFVSGLAKQHGVWIVAGSIPCAARPDGSGIEDRVRSTCWVFDSQGCEVSRYDKIHLFDVDVADSHGSYKESETFEPGSQLKVVDTPLGLLGLSICYDLRFPSLYSALSGQGATILSVPAAFTYKTGEAHWEVLLRARAIENQCYIVAANQTGSHSKNRQTWGHSMIIDPWGKVIACLDSGEGVVSAEIDVNRLAELRSAMPVMSHRRV